jgi:hypothetical protein
MSESVKLKQQVILTPTVPDASAQPPTLARNVPVTLFRATGGQKVQTRNASQPQGSAQAEATTAVQVKQANCSKVVQCPHCHEQLAVTSAVVVEPALKAGTQRGASSTAAPSATQGSPAVHAAGSSQLCGGVGNCVLPFTASQHTIQPKAPWASDFESSGLQTEAMRAFRRPSSHDKDFVSKTPHVFHSTATYSKVLEQKQPRCAIHYLCHFFEGVWSQ